AAADLGAGTVARAHAHLHGLALAIDQPVQGGAGGTQRRGERRVPARALRIVERAGEAGEAFLHALEHALAHLRAHGRIGCAAARRHAWRTARAGARLALRRRSLALRLGPLALCGKRRIERGTLAVVELQFRRLALELLEHAGAGPATCGAARCGFG